MTPPSPTLPPPLRTVSGLAPSGHGLPVIRLDEPTYDRALDCVRCGLCLPACPTYLETGLEADSPRGRVQIVKGLADGQVQPSEAIVQHLDLCLDCRACETACPSGVVYHELIEAARPQLEDLRSPTWAQRLVRASFLHVLTHPVGLRLALLPARALQRLGLWGLTALATRWPALRALDTLRRLLPVRGPLWPERLPRRFASKGPRRAVVALLEGCVASALAPELNRQTCEVLAALGCEVIVPRRQACCGAVAHHAGASDLAREQAGRNLRALLRPEPCDEESPWRLSDHLQAAAGSTPQAMPSPDYIVTNVAGCGAMLKEYPELFHPGPKGEEARQAAELARKSRDVCELVAALMPPNWAPQGQPGGLKRVERTVAVHDACHLAHAQRVAGAARSLLALVPGLRCVPLTESDHCCGAAGTYNLTQPEMAQTLAARKLDHLARAGVEECVTGNLGCAMHLAAEARRRGQALRLTHPIALLHEAMLG